jgi:uncharacterized membrane protein YfcA
MRPLDRLTSDLAIGGIAFLYSSVGHGGATGYLAIMALLGVAPTLARPGALWMNCFVASVGFWRFHRDGLFDVRVFLPLASASIPLAWLGSRLRLDGWVYDLVLGVALLFAGGLLAWGRRESAAQVIRRPALPAALFVGAVLGFLSGMTGIGGGVYLTPLLIFLRWTPAKVAGGVSALFIVVNSIAGLTGLGRGALIWEPIFVLAPVIGVAMAFAATTLSVRRWNVATFRRVLAVVLWLAAAKSFMRIFHPG